MFELKNVNDGMAKWSERLNAQNCVESSMLANNVIESTTEKYI